MSAPEASRDWFEPEGRTVTVSQDPKVIRPIRCLISGMSIGYARLENLWCLSAKTAAIATSGRSRMF